MLFGKYKTQVKSKPSLQKKEIKDKIITLTFSMVEFPDDHPVDYIPHADGAVLRCRYQA
jgi:hypothetical protein